MTLFPLMNRIVMIMIMIAMCRHVVLILNLDQVSISRCLDYQSCMEACVFGGGNRVPLLHHVLSRWWWCIIFSASGMASMGHAWLLIIWPQIVLSPVATTIPTPSPFTTLVDIKTMFWLKMPFLSSVQAVVHFRGCFSCAKLDMSTYRHDRQCMSAIYTYIIYIHIYIYIYIMPTVKSSEHSMRRQSAATMSPAIWMLYNDRW